MNRLSDRDLEEYLNQIEQYHITIPTEGKEPTFMKLEDLQPPPVNRRSMKSADLETKVAFMPRDIVGQWIARIGNVWDALFAKEKL